MNEHLKHMDVGSRNARLCATLQGMGLFVLPVFAEDDPERIDYMQVSVDLPTRSVEQAAKQTASGSIAPPVSSPQVVRMVGAAEASRMNVIDFPSKLRQFAVLTPANESAVAVHPNIGIPYNGAGF